MMRLLSVFFAFALAAVLSVTAFAGTFTDDQKKEMEDIIHSYLTTHPEVLKEMVQKLDAQEKKDAADAQDSTLSSAAKDIYHDGIDGTAGNPDGDVTVVEFMDYQCGWCRKSIKEMQSVVGSDKKVRVVFKEFPIFGYTSDYAARAALASVKQNKYWAFHQALFAAHLPSVQNDTDEEHKAAREGVEAVAKSVGIDLEKLKTDMKDPAIDANIAKTRDLATALQFTGTPGFIVGDTIFPGYEPQDKILATIASTRANGGCKYC